jgi:DNA-binding NarL/FixJ family response regulator
VKQYGLELVKTPVAPSDLRVVVADDQPVVRAGLHTMLTAAGVLVAAEAATGTEAVEAAVTERPDVLILDLRLRELSGVAVIREVLLRAPEIGVLVFSAVEDDESLLTAVRAGARGYLLKSSTHSQLVRGTQGVAAGESIFSPDVAIRVRALLARSPQRDHHPFPTLTIREREVLALLAAGIPNSAIAHKLRLAPKTVSNHISSIYVKLGLTDRTEAIMRARDAGLGATATSF